MVDNLRENPYYGLDERLENYQKEKEYNLSYFQDRIVEFPWTFKVIPSGKDENGNEIVHLEHYEGEVIDEGTDLSEKYLGNMDTAIAILYKWREETDNMLLQLALKSDSLEMTTLNGMVANSYVATFSDLTGIKIKKGYYDKARGEVWS